MSLEADQNLPESGRSDPLTLEERAAALVNPASGLANDFLNVYNEILMLIDMLPTMPELIDDINAWRPSSYRAYFMQSPLPGSQATLEVYGQLEPGFRALFEASVEQLAETGVTSVQAIQNTVAFGAENGGRLAEVCAEATRRLRLSLAPAEQLVNFGRIAPGREKQAYVNELISAA